MMANDRREYQNRHRIPSINLCHKTQRMNFGQMSKSAVHTNALRIHGWSPVIHTDDPLRGGKLAAFVLYLLDKTDLVWGSIANYVWGVRTWLTLQYQADPIQGVMH